MKRKTLAPFRLAVDAVRHAVDAAESSTQAGQPPSGGGMYDALVDAERARADASGSFRTLGDAHELAWLESELTRAYRRVLTLTRR